MFIISRWNFITIILILLISMFFVFFFNSNNVPTEDISTLSFIQSEKFNNDLFSLYYTNNSENNFTHLYGITTSDFNHDGNIDFAFSYSISNKDHRIAIAYSEKNLKFSYQDIFSFSYNYITDLDAVDFDNDGDIDLIFTYNEFETMNGSKYNINGTINLLENDGDEQFNRIFIAKRGTGIKGDLEGRINMQISSIDFDNDGDIDFFIGDNSGKVELFENLDLEQYQGRGILIDFGHASWGLDFADFDNNGFFDLIVAAENNEIMGEGNYLIKWNYGKSLFLKKNIVNDIGNLTSGTASISTIDYENDDDIDFISGGINSFSLFINNNKSFNKYYLNIPVKSNDFERFIMGVIETADFNNDGYDDFIAGGENGILRLLINNYSSD